MLKKKEDESSKVMAIFDVLSFMIIKIKKDYMKKFNIIFCVLYCMSSIIV